MGESAHLYSKCNCCSLVLLLAVDDLVPLLLQRGDNRGVGLKIGIIRSFSHNYHQLPRYPCFNLKIGIIRSFSQNYHGGGVAELLVVGSDLAQDAPHDLSRAGLWQGGGVL